MRLKMVVATISILILGAGCATQNTQGKDSAVSEGTGFTDNVTGTWVAKVAAPKGGPGGGSGGTWKFTFNFKADGDNLGGTMVGPLGRENKILDGKIDGDRVSFAVKVRGGPGGNKIKYNYKGAVSGDEMKLTFSMAGGMGGMGGGNRPPLIAKRQK